jgi:hypothetical protein
VKFSARVFNKRMKKLKGLPSHLVDEALEITKSNTPIASGNARRNTKKQSNKIVSDYAYADRLDNGYSKQAPQGFTKPTIEQLDDEAQKFIRKI